MSLPGQGNPNELTQQVNSQAAYVGVEDGSVPQCEDSSFSLGSISLSSSFTLTTPEFHPQPNLSFEDDELNPYPVHFGLESVPLAETEDLNPIPKSSATALSSLGEGNNNELPQQSNSHQDQRLNSQRNVEEEVRRSEPNRSPLDRGEEEASDQASNGPKQRGRKRKLTPAEKGTSKIDRAGASAEAHIGQNRRLTPAEKGTSKIDRAGASAEAHIGQNRRLTPAEKGTSKIDRAGASAEAHIGQKRRLTPAEKGKIKIDRAGASAEAHIGQKRRAREPIILTKEQQLKKKEKKKQNDIEYRKNNRKDLNEYKNIKPQYERLMKIASYFGGIDNMETQINSMRSEFSRLQQKEVEYDMFRQVMTEAEFQQLGQMKSKYGGMQAMESMLDKFEEIEAKSLKLDQMKSKYGEIEEMETILDKFKEMEAELHRFDQIKSLFPGFDEIEPEINRLKKKELQLEKHNQLVNQREPESFQFSPGSLQQMEIEECHRQQQNEAADFYRFEQLKSKFGGAEQMELKLDKFHQMEADFHQLEQLKSKFGGTEQMELKLDKFHQMETDLQRLEELKSKFGGTEQIEHKLDKFHIMEAELQRFEQVKSMFGGQDEIETQINRLKKIQLQHRRNKQKELQFFTESPGSLQEQRGSPSLDLNDDSDMVSECGISLMSAGPLSGKTPEIQYSDVFVKKFVAKLDDENAVSSVDDSSFEDLSVGDHEVVGKFKIPRSLVSTARDIFNAHGDITNESKYSRITVQTIYVLCCAAIKEMGDLSLEDVTEEIMLKWRDAIKDAKRSECDVEFAMKHLKKIAYGYFGLKAYMERNSLKLKMRRLKADQEALSKELEKKSKEIKTVKAKHGDLKSEQCKICMESADQFSDKTVGVF